MQTVYFDYNATTPVDERVVSAMLPYYLNVYGNPSNMNSAHGKEANRAYKKSLRTIADYFHVESTDGIILTSGATESNNLVIKSLVGSAKKPCRIITSKIEHDSVIKTLESLSDSVIIDYVENDGSGRINLADLESRITEDTVLVTIIGANNEIGTIQPIEEIAEIAHRHGVPFHCDATQLVPHRRIDLLAQNIDYVSMSGHKIYAPKGVGLLLCRDDRALNRITPQIVGGGQQNGYRSGTINVPGIVSLAEAVKLLDAEMESDNAICNELFGEFFRVLDAEGIPYRLNGDTMNRIEGNISISIEGLTSVQLLAALSEFSISTGSACSTGKESHVLRAIGCPKEVISGTIRIGYGRFSKMEEIIALAEKLVGYYNRVYRNN